MEPKILGVGPRTAAFLRTIYPKSRAKLIARDFRVSIGTAERWLKGEAPTVAHMEQMVKVFGEPYVRAVFLEAFEQHDVRVKELEASTLRVAAVAGLSGVAAGLHYVRGLADRGVTVLYELANWAGTLIGSTSHDLLAAPSDITSMLLLEGLIDTVPDALPAPEQEAHHVVPTPVSTHET